MNIETKTTLNCMTNSRGFQVKGLNGYTLSIGIGSGHYCENYNLAYNAEANAYKPTSTMEVAIMSEDGTFVCLPWDVAAHVPASNLGRLIAAVEDHNWERVCNLCYQDIDDVYNKFPKKD